MKQYPNYSKVDKKYRWDLEDILQGKTIKYWFEKYEEIFQKLIEIKDSKFDDISSFIDSLKLSDDLSLIYNKISNYLSNKSNENLIDPEIQKLSTEFENINENLSEKFGSDLNRLFKNIDKVKTWINDSRLAKYKRSLQDVINSYDHKLSDDVEEYITRSSFGYPKLDDIFSILTDSELDYKDVYNSKNKKFHLDPASYVKLTKSNDACLRKNAVLQYNKAKLQHKESLASLLVQEFKSISVDAKIRKYKSSIDMLTFEDKVNDEILNSLFTNVANLKEDISKFQKFYKLFYEQKYKEKYRPRFDKNRELINVKTNYSIEEIQNITKTIFNDFPAEYSLKINEAIDTNWIDYMMVKNKISGAYSIGESYGIDKKYILMNFDGELSSLETLCHELGHSMHSYFSDKNNDLVNSNYPIILAEIASIFNELILYDYLLKNNENNDKFKFYIYTKMIEGFIGTTVTQTMWANYEYDLYNKIDKNEVSQSYTDVAKIYYDAVKKYSKKSYKFDPNKCVASVTIPHFYMGFYVYKYAIGQLVANYFYSQYQKEGNDFINKYINNFLSAGCRDYPLEILKSMNVDLSSQSFYESGFNYFKETIDKWIKLGKKIFKIKQTKNT
ncbi:oligoendopeptidase F [Mycoplasmopsis felifaucium]|uniref:oligoendopeptidase F n=1 Tax=Mycoplasmopsis felifaucium TaxID=35768 RepID=UPI0004828E6D|nr:oligoendopeptidase F [Mycoplasmopsis felifaucium]